MQKQIVEAIIIVDFHPLEKSSKQRGCVQFCRSPFPGQNCQSSDEELTCITQQSHGRIILIRRANSFQK
jgi:hypothetical protein